MALLIRAAGHGQPSLTFALTPMHPQRFSSKFDRVAFILCLSTLMGGGCAAEKNLAKAEMKKMQGTWQLVYQQMDGRKLPDEEGAKMFHGKMIITTGKLHYSVELPGFDFEFAYKLHPDQQPKAIDLRLTHSRDRQDIGQEYHGIYLLEADTLKICHSDTNRPTEFSAEEGSRNSLIVLKRKVRQR
jgi:uncharacterized protein (TIGR03067 family)